MKKDDLTVMFSAHSKFFKYLFKDFDYGIFGFPKTALFVLVILKYKASDESVKMSELEAHAGMKKSTLSESVDLLVKEGYIERARSKEDRRVVRVNLTPKGEKKVNEITEIVKRHVDEKLKILSDEERESLFRSFEIIEEVAEKLKESN